MTILSAWAKGESVPEVHPAPAPSSPTLHDLIGEYAASRVDVGPSQQSKYRKASGRLSERLGATPVDQLGPADFRAWIASMGNLKPATIRTYLGAVREALDHGEVEPNPARHQSVRIPKAGREVIDPPSAAQIEAIAEVITPRHLFALRLIEGTGLRVGEAGELAWGDLDARTERIRVRGTKTRSAMRWTPVEPELLDQILASCPHEDRSPERPIIPGFNDKTFRHALARACRDSGTPVYSPHDLRHRYISLLVQAGVPAPIVGQIVGHAKASITLDTYAHVLTDDPRERLQRLYLLAIKAVSGVPLVLPPASVETGREEESLQTAGTG